MIKGILFDMDGVLVDSEQVITKAAMLCLNEYGVFPKKEDFKEFTGTGEDNFIGGVARKYGLTFLIEMKKRTYDIYDEIVKGEILVYDEVLKTLLHLKEQGFKMAVCSSADRRKVIVNLKSAGIDLNIFEAILSSEDVEFKKPFPDIFIKGATALGLKTSECVVIEDALSGILAANRARCKSIAVPTSFDKETLEKTTANFIVENFKDLKDILRKETLFCGIVKNGFFNHGKVNSQIENLTSELVKRGIIFDVLDHDSLNFVTSDQIQSHLKMYDFIIYLDKDMHLSTLLEKSNYRLFNSKQAIEICDDKMRTILELTNKNIKMPKTISSPIMYCETNNEQKEQNFLKHVITQLKFPIVVKECYGSMGKQVYLASDENELRELRAKLKLKPHIYQEFIESSKGKDVRIFVVGGRKVASVLRRNETDFRSNLELGGRAEFYDNEKFNELAEKVSNILGLDFCGVDILFGKNDEPIVCEINSNAFFNGLEDFTKINISEKIIEDILMKLS